MVLHILRFSSGNEFYLEHNTTFEQIMRDIKAANHFLHLFEASIELALLDGDVHSSKEWNGNPNESRMERTVLKLMNDDRIPQHYKGVPATDKAWMGTPAHGKD